VGCCLDETIERPELQIFGNRCGLISLANTMLWFAANAWRREFLSLAELEFVELAGQLSVGFRLTDNEGLATHGIISRRDNHNLLEWTVSENGLIRVALLIHRLACRPEHEYDRLLMESDMGVQIRLTDAVDWLRVAD
jgi:hypothetical protein